MPRWHWWPSAEKSDQVLTLDLIVFVLQYASTARSRGTFNTNLGTFRAMRKFTLKPPHFPHQKPVLVKAFPRKDMAIQGNKWDRCVRLLLLCRHGSMLPTSLPWLGCFGPADLPYKQPALLLYFITHLHLISTLQDKGPPGQEHSDILLHEHHLEYALFSPSLSNLKSQILLNTSSCHITIPQMDKQDCNIFWLYNPMWKSKVSRSWKEGKNVLWWFR